MKPQYILFTIIGLMQIASGFMTWWAFDKSEEVKIYATNMYMLMNALSWVFAFGIIALLTTGLFRQLVIIMVALWIGKVIDELFFDPTVPQWNDLVNLLIAENLALIAFVRHITKRK